MYELNHYYYFNVLRINDNNIDVEDSYGRSHEVEGYDFQTRWDFAARNGRLRCFVKGEREEGKLILEQSKCDLFRFLYPKAFRQEAEACKFDVDRYMKTERGELIYRIEDAYGLKHIYKSSDEHNSLRPSDEVKLTVLGVREDEEGNNCFLIFKEDTFEDAEIVPTEEEANATVATDGDGVGEFGLENDQLEFKKTIICPNGSEVPNIDFQMQIIVKTLAGFMNANGGTLLIGVNDDGTAVGIENDYQSLNSSEEDKASYTPNENGYQRKIRSSIRHYLNAVAEDYVKFHFSKHQGVTVCRIDVQSSYSVIWFNEREAYKRLGNCNKLLKSEAIEKLVLDKAAQRPIGYVVKPTPIAEEEASLANNAEGYDNSVDEELEEVPAPEKVKNKGNVRNGDGSFYLNLFSTGQYSWTHNIPTDTDLEFCIPINNPTDKQNLIMVHEDGCVNKVNAYGLCQGKNENERRGNWHRRDGVKLVKAFSAQDNDMLACFSTQAGSDFVKVHAVSEVSMHSTLNAEGNIIFNHSMFPGITKSDIYFVSAVHAYRVSALNDLEEFKIPKSRKTRTLGKRMDLPGNDMLLDALDTLRSVCDVIPQGQNV